jgi:large repetitive protein
MTCTELCGDGFNMGIDECDDKNTVSGDGCDSNCTVELGWTCGTGSFARPDLCFEICGDGRSLKSYSKMGNMCDDGNNYNGDGCDADCVLEYGYECLGGDAYTPDTCSEVCGDGYNIGLNPCDDGNNKSNS